MRIKGSFKAARVIAPRHYSRRSADGSLCLPQAVPAALRCRRPGLSEKALALADDVVYISQFGSVRSINAGAAAAVAMHAWIAQHAVSGV